ncbi:MAG: YybH family protein [Hyphomicrobiales bacterium]
MFRVAGSLLALTLVTFTAAVASPAKAPSPASGDAVRAEVQAFVKRYIDAANKADVSAMMEMFCRCDNVSSVTDGAITHGWEAIREDTDQFAGKQGTFRFALGTIDVEPLGAGYALAVAPLVVTVASPDDTLEANGALTLLLEREGGKWRILHEHMSGQEPDQDLGPGDDDQDPGMDGE